MSIKLRAQVLIIEDLPAAQEGRSTSGMSAKSEKRQMTNLKADEGTCRCMQESNEHGLAYSTATAA